MKIAASIFSWFGGVVETIYSYFIMREIQGIYGISLSRSWLWGIFLVGIVLRLSILIWREKSVGKGNKIACGVLTLIFVSFIGGILTLRIPQDQLYENKYVPKKIYSNSSSAIGLTQKEIEDKVNIYKSMLQKGTITLTEYEEKMKRLGVKTVGEEHKVDLLKKYKNLLDDGVIDQDEFDKKKQEIL